MANELQKKYEEKIKTALMEKYHYKSVMQVPRIEKIVINAGVGDATKDAKFIEAMYNEIQNITGQKPIMTKAKKALAAYRLREGQNIGVKVTLRGANMWNFIDKLINVALPRVRDFKGISKRSFDGHGNYTLGIKEQIIFNEINFDEVKRVRGFDTTFVISKGNDEESLALLTAVGMPFDKR